MQILNIEQTVIISNINKLNNYKENKIKFEKYIKILNEKFNNIFKTIDLDIKKINNTKNIKTRNNKLRFADALFASIIYTKKDITMDKVVNILNLTYNIDIKRTSLSDKINKIPLLYYEQLFKEFQKLHDILFPFNGIKHVAVDGTFNNTNDKRVKQTLQTSENLGIYDTINNIPINIIRSDFTNKTHETVSLTKQLEKHTIANSILILDRAYHSKELLKTMDDEKLKFVVRYRNNTTLNHDNINDFLKELPNSKHLRIITFKTPISKLSEYEDFNYVIEHDNEYIIVTNLDNKQYNDKSIEEIYSSRWNIEVFFKLIKSNFKFQHIDSKNINDSYQKMYLIEMLLVTMISIIEKTYLLQKYTLSDIETKNIKVNKSTLLDAMFLVMFDITHSKLTFAKVNCLFKTSIIIMINSKNRHFYRHSLKPYTKWYAKHYSEKSKYLRIVKIIVTGDIKLLNEDKNKNLKTLLMHVKIFKINQDKSLTEVENKIKIEIENENKIKQDEINKIKQDKLNLKRMKEIEKRIQKLEKHYKIEKHW